MSLGAKAFWVLCFAVLTALGLITLVETQARGEGPAEALVILALPLLLFGRFVVLVGSRFLSHWRYGRGRLQKLVVGVMTAVLVGAGLVALVQATVESQRPGPQLTAALSSACRGEAVSAAGVLDRSGTRLNHLIVLDENGNEHDWTGFAPIDWRPPTLEDAELVACISADETRAQIQVCQYSNGPSIHRFRVSRDVKVVEAATARVIAQFEVSDDPRSCGFSERRDVTELSGDVTWAMVAARCDSIVQAGSYTPGAGDEQTPPPLVTLPPEPTHVPPETEPPVADVITLASAIEHGLVEVTLSGDGLQELDVELASRSSNRLLVTVPAGTMLDPNRDATQSMVVTQTTQIDLLPGEDGAWELPVACAEMRRDQPTASDHFTLRSRMAQGDLARLLATDQFLAQPLRVQQFAVWTITNNPARNRYVGLGTVISIVGTGPSDEEFAAIRDLFKVAGIGPRDYRALR